MSHLTLVPAYALFSPNHTIPTKGDPKRWLHPDLFDVPEARHIAVMSLFGRIDSDQPRSEAGIVFRVDPSPDGPAFLVRSRIEPARLPQTGRTKPAPDVAIEPGTQVRFRIAVNAVKRQGNKELPLGLLEVPSWLSGRVDVEQALTDIMFHDHTRDVLGVDRRGRKLNPAGVKTRRVLQLDYFDGVATVRDTSALNHLLATGVGRSKSYGAGLLTVAL